MLKNQCVIYALDKRIGGMSAGDRVSLVRRELMKFHCHELEEREKIESRDSLDSRKAILHLLDRYDANPHDDPIIAISTWKEINHPEVARRLYDGSYSVVIADQAVNFDRQENRGEFIYNGPVLDHVSENKGKLKSYLDSLERSETLGENAINQERKNSGEVFAEKMWIQIERIARKSKTTVQSEIARCLNEEGYGTIEGAEISQTHVHRFISRARKFDEWDSLKKAFPVPIKKKRKKRGPDLFDALKQESDPESR